MAIGALRRHTIGVAAVVAGEGVHVLVIGEGDIAVSTARHPSALVTFYDGRKASSVLEKNDLLAVMKCISDSHSKVRRQDTSHHLAMTKILYIYHLNLRQFDVLESLC
jgi:hypothetical protein